MLSEPIARQESFLTLQRIRAAQARYWFTRLLLLWIFLTIIVFVIVTASPARKQNTGAWVWSTLVSAVRPTAPVPWRGQHYAAGELATYLNNAVYGGTLGGYVQWSAFVAAGPSVGLMMLILHYVRRGQGGEQHLRGAEVIATEELTRRLKKAGESGVNIAGVKIPRQLEQSHILICGATGAGKSVTIRSLLRQYAERGEACIVVDPEGEFVAEFYDEDRGDALLNPFDARCIDWQPRYEGESEADIAAQAASLFPIIPGSSSAAQYYHAAARRTYRQLFAVGGHDPRRIPELLADANGAAKHFSVSREIVSTMQNAVEFFRHLRPGVRRWSAREWVTDPRGWVFLTFREADKEAALPFLSLMLESLSRRLLSRPIGAMQTIRIVIDELATVQAQESLGELLTRARKRNVSILLGFQDIHQLYPIYGKDMTHSMLNQPSTRLLLRTNDSETQEWCAANVGRREVIRAEQSETVGPENVRDAFHLSHPRRTEETVMDAEFGQMPNLHGILKVAHYGAARVTVPYVGMQQQVAAFVARREGNSQGQPLRRTSVDLSTTRRKL